MKTILYFYDNSFAHVRRRLAGMLPEARKRRWHVEAIDMTGRLQSLDRLLRFWKPDGLIVQGSLHDSRMRLNGFVKRTRQVQSWSINLTYFEVILT